MLTQAEANYLFYYDPINGKLYWKHPKARRLKAGDKAEVKYGFHKNHGKDR